MEISLGNAGNTTDGFTPLETFADLSCLEEASVRRVQILSGQYQHQGGAGGGAADRGDGSLQATWRSASPALLPSSWDRNNFFLMFGDQKPVMYLRSDLYFKSYDPTNNADVCTELCSQTSGGECSCPT